MIHKTILVLLAVLGLFMLVLLNPHLIDTLLGKARIMPTVAIAAPVDAGYPAPGDTPLPPTLPAPPVSDTRPAPSNDCPPPPWSDLAQAQRCHLYYPSPNNVTLPDCEYALSPLAPAELETKLLCAGYLLPATPFP